MSTDLLARCGICFEKLAETPAPNRIYDAEPPWAFCDNCARLLGRA